MRREILGTALSRGTAFGRLARFAAAEERGGTGAANGAGRRDRLESAIARADGELAALASRLDESAAPILEFQRELLHDPSLWRMVHDAAPDVTAEEALAAAFAHYAAMLESLDDAALRARVHDLRDVELRLSTCLSAPTAERREDASFEMPTILVAAALFPSELAALDRTAVRGLCLTDVGIDSHTAILARALQIPAIAVDAASRAGLTDGANAWLDGSGGRLVIEPHADEMAAAEDERMPVAEFVGAAPVRITAAAASAAEAAFACASGAAGIGLLRTEFLFAAHTAPPRVDEHAAAIRAVAEACPGRTVTVRLLDAGGDKPLGFVGHSREPNPALGMRGARVLVANPDLVRAQAAGIAAVAREGRRVRVSIPMVVDVPEALQVRAVLDEAFDDLPADLRPKIGVMIEVPAAAILADEFAAAFDFLSIGSSDLAQYVLAADRADGRYRAYGGASHAAVQRCIEGVVRAARRQGRPISLCGDAVGNPEAVRAFIAFGGDELVAPADRLAAVRAAAGG